MIEIGQTREIYKNDKYPSVMELINKPIREKEKVLHYMKKSHIDAVAPARLRDIINPENTIPELFYMSDDIYGWRSDVIYYVEKYDMALPDEFVQHVLSQTNKKAK